MCKLLRVVYRDFQVNLWRLSQNCTANVTASVVQADVCSYILTMLANNLCKSAFMSHLSPNAA